MKEFFLIALYLWVVFGLFVLYKSVLLAEENVTFVFQGFALINALAFGKVILIARAFHLGEGFDEAPLIYPTLLKSALFTILLACCKILEEAAVGHFRGKTLHESLTDLGGGTLRGMLTLSVLMFVMLIPFFAIGELQRVLGEGKLSQLFFRARLPTEEPKRES
jgi:hypothetical protein